MHAPPRCVLRGSHAHLRVRMLSVCDSHTSRRRSSCLLRRQQGSSHSRDNMLGLAEEVAQIGANLPPLACGGGGRRGRLRWRPPLLQHAELLVLLQLREGDGSLLRRVV